MHLCVMAERLEMAAAKHCVSNGFPVRNLTFPEPYFPPESLRHQLLKDFQLYCPQNMHPDFLQPFLPGNIQQRLLRLQ